MKNKYMLSHQYSGGKYFVWNSLFDHSEGTVVDVIAAHIGEARENLPSWKPGKTSTVDGIPLSQEMEVPWQDVTYRLTLVIPLHKTGVELNRMEQQD